MAQLRDKGVSTVIDGAPLCTPCNWRQSAGRHDSGGHRQERPRILEDDYLEIITGTDVEPRIVYPNGYKRVNRFAFVIHPLSQEYFKKVKPIEMLSQVSPPVLMDSLEKSWPMRHRLCTPA